VQKSGIRRKDRLFKLGLAAVATVIGLKLLAHGMGWEVISLNPLFSGIIAANVFLMGFLLTGVLADYKESERLPGELACSLETIADEAATIYKTKHSPDARRCFDQVLDLTLSIREWLHKRARTKAIMDKVDVLSTSFSAIEPVSQVNYVARLKQEQSNIRRILIRIHTIRETGFISSGYLVAEVTTVMLTIGLVLAKIDPFYESLFFVGVITFLLVFLNLLIRDLDNPFGYYEESSCEDVSLKPLEDLEDNLKGISVGYGVADAASKH
jgi:predicted membrane chloride channel (bestrophin family)